MDKKMAFLSLVGKIIHLNENHILHVLKFTRFEEVKKNMVILQHSNVCNKFYFMLEGGIRLYYRDQKGKEKTRLVLFDNAPFTALLSFITGHPTAEIIEALEDSALAVVSRRDFYQLVKDIPEWSSFYTMMLEKTYIYQNSRLEQLATLSAAERYRKVLSESPQYIQRLSNGILASYLDISQETLSRLKSR